MAVELGDHVKDPVTGFAGVAVGRHQYMTGCTRISVQPPIDKDGKMAEVQTFDEPMLQVLKKKRVIVPRPAALDPGGPEPFRDVRRH